MLNRYAIAALGAMAVVIVVYLSKFFPIFGFSLSRDPAVWGQFGDYIGGALNPTLSFISIVLLIKSVTLQNEANIDLRNELKNSRKTEHFRSFNSLFFNMIESQTDLFKNFRIASPAEEGVDIFEYGVAAVLYIEDEIERRRETGADDTAITEYLKEVDSEDQIFGVMRAFYISVKVVFDKLSEENGFCEKDRKEQLLALINFMDFAQLRMVLIGMQFLNYRSSDYLRENTLFIATLGEVELQLGLY